jgi:hypothetical protein
LRGIQLDQTTSTSLFFDNQSVLKMVKNPIYNARTNHIELHHHYIKKLVENEEICLYYCLIVEQTTNIMTKPLSNVKFIKFRDKLGIVSGLVIKGGVKLNKSKVYCCPINTPTQVCCV